MKRVVAIFFALVYLVSTAGVTVSSFYCCGKLKATYLFSSHDFGKDCKNDKKTAGCCDTKTFYAKVKDSHTPSSQFQLKSLDASKLLNLFSSELFIYPSAGCQTTSFAYLHAPPLISKQPVYLAVCSFRI